MREGMDGGVVGHGIPSARSFEAGNMSRPRSIRQSFLPSELTIPFSLRVDAPSEQPPGARTSMLVRRPRQSVGAIRTERDVPELPSTACHQGGDIFLRRRSVSELSGCIVAPAVDVSLLGDSAIIGIQTVAQRRVGSASRDVGRRPDAIIGNEDASWKVCALVFAVLQPRRCPWRQRIQDLFRW